MKQIKNLREIQILEYEILKKFTKFCNKYNLRYCLAGGTLLGSIRHQGFIPWDDDIDIAMPRPDFEKFINLLKENNVKEELENLELASYELDKDYIYPITKLYDKRTIVELNDHIVDYPLGLWIDIFVFDGVSNNKLIRNIKFKYQRFLTYLNVMSITKFGVKRKNKMLTYGQFLLYPVFFIARVIGHKNIVGLLEKNTKSYSFENSDFIGIYAGRGLENEVMPKNEVINFKKVKFENSEFNVPGNYDYYLKKLYGNYMQLPPENQRETRHDVKIYWKED